AHGGLGRWVRLRDERDDLAVAATLRRAGVALQAGRPCFAGEAAGAYLRLSVGAAGPAELRRATGLLASVLSA
ncbi:MAG: PLP-dependent aminotransferase family protein, partial [Acidimicrobiia bacterium]